MKYIYLIISVVGSIYLGGLLIGYNYSNQNGLYINIDFYFQIFFIYPQLFITIGSAYLFFKKLNENVAINDKIITTKNPSVEKQKKKNLNSNLNSKIQNQTNLQNSNIGIDYKEEEEIYSKVALEFANNKKEGLWTKALVESEGDESKAKFNYIKQRVEQLQAELKELKVQKENILIREKEESVIFEKLDKQNLTAMSKLLYLIQFHKKYQIDNKALIPSKFIEFLITKYNPVIHKADLFPDLIKLVKIIKTADEDKGDFIPLEHVEEIYNKYNNTSAIGLF